MDIVGLGGQVFALGDLDDDGVRDVIRLSVVGWESKVQIMYLGDAR